MPKNLLETHGTHVSISDLEMCLETIKEYNPWFLSDDNLMDMENWTWGQINVEKRLLTKGQEGPCGQILTDHLCYALFCI